MQGVKGWMGCRESRNAGVVKCVTITLECFLCLCEVEIECYLSTGHLSSSSN